MDMIEASALANPWNEKGLALDRLDALPQLPYRYPDGWMSPLELRILYTLARRSAGPALEIGPWIGRSTSAIAAGLRDGGRSPAPIFDVVDFGPASAEEWKQRFGLPMPFDPPMIPASVFHPGGSLAVLIDNLRRNGLLGQVNGILRGDLLELPIGRRYAFIFCDAVHGKAEAARTMPRLAELVADEAVLVFDDVVSEAFADAICAHLNPVRRFLLAPNNDGRGKLLVVQHRAAPSTKMVQPRPAEAAEALAARRVAASAIWRRELAAQGIERSVLITSTFRSGSTFVSSLLSQAGLRGLNLERFAEAWRYTLQPPGEEFAAFLRGIFAEAAEGRFAAKLMWPHFARLAEATGHERGDIAELAALFAPAHWIQVRRADKFDQAISFWRAKSSGRWHVFEEEEEPELPYDFRGILESLHEIELHDRMWDDVFAMAGITPIRLIYEEVEADTTGAMAATFDMLGLPGAAAPGTLGLRRQRDDHSMRLREMFVRDLYRA
ncbi:class I SAM-dependent methyltransferase [Roseomonas sp. HJA6]|uniref:Class I SAM-dependent methyltransferase n=1 Tax=Roseomonas alba TaxID=2846776 RepID=A0ABS7A9Y4_9PROT|nr:Stf0 family sulfotransferase [Neoroseomonas alba]MBW6398582.1 class I SAM-dependent methyltransferase [Neoroseomonas alba]